MKGSSSVTSSSWQGVVEKSLPMDQISLLSVPTNNIYGRPLLQSTEWTSRKDCFHVVRIISQQKSQELFTCTSTIGENKAEDTAH